MRPLSVGSFPGNYARGNHLDEVIRNAKLFQAFRGDAGRGLVIIDAATVAIFWFRFS